eukprot:60307-Hanusia_phi.AAC.3
MDFSIAGFFQVLQIARAGSVHPSPPLTCERVEYLDEQNENRNEKYLGKNSHPQVQRKGFKCLHGCYQHA